MKKKEPVLKTKRLLLQPMTEQQTQKLIDSQDTEELRTAYGEMLAGSRNDPENRLWYTPWQMTLKADHSNIGDLCFKGPARDNAVEIGYGILPAYEGRGYTTEAVQAMTRWAFDHENVVFVEAETDPDNKASQRVLEKCGFTPDGAGGEGPRFVLEKPMTSWMTIYMLFGISIGTSLGASLNSVGVGISMGLCLGLCIGTALDASARKEREKCREQRRQRRNESIST